MKLELRVLVSSAALMFPLAVHAVPYTFAFEAPSAGFGWGGPVENPPPPPSGVLLALGSQPISGSFTIETEVPSQPTYFFDNGVLVEVGANYSNPVLNFDMRIGTTVFSFTSVRPTNVPESRISILDLPVPMYDMYDLDVNLGEGLLAGYESYTFRAGISWQDYDGTGGVNYSNLLDQLFAGRTWMFALSLYDSEENWSYQLFTDRMSLTPAQVPEPDTLALFGLGLALCAIRRRQMRS